MLLSYLCFLFFIPLTALRSSPTLGEQHHADCSQAENHIDKLSGWGWPPKVGGRA